MGPYSLIKRNLSRAGGKGCGKINGGERDRLSNCRQKGVKKTLPSVGKKVVSLPCYRGGVKGKWKRSGVGGRAS